MVLSSLVNTAKFLLVYSGADQGVKIFAGLVWCWSGLALVPNQRSRTTGPAFRTKIRPATKQQSKKRFKLARTKQIIAKLR